MQAIDKRSLLPDAQTSPRYTSNPTAPDSCQKILKMMLLCSSAASTVSVAPTAAEWVAASATWSAAVQSMACRRGNDVPGSSRNNFQEAGIHEPTAPPHKSHSTHTAAPSTMQAPCCVARRSVHNGSNFRKNRDR